MKEPKKKRWDLILLIGTTLMLVDFLTTYWGINVLGVISEANPLMVWMFEIGFIPALIMRIIFVGIVAKLTLNVKVEDPNWYKYLTTFIFIINIGVMILHIRWVSIHFG